MIGVGSEGHNRGRLALLSRQHPALASAPPPPQLEGDDHGIDPSRGRSWPLVRLGPGRFLGRRLTAHDARSVDRLRIEGQESDGGLGLCLDLRLTFLRAAPSADYEPARVVEERRHLGQVLRPERVSLSELPGLIQKAYLGLPEQLSDPPRQRRRRNLLLLT